jgi:hypothetical protein
MVRIKYNGSDEALQKAVAGVNALFLDVRFYNAIGTHRYFDKANISPVNLSLLIRNTRMDMKIDFYYALYPFSKALTFDDDEQPQTIWLNKWNLKRSAGSLANTLVHQCIHAVNSRNREFSFGHGDNSSSGKDNTAPFWIAALAQQMLEKEDTPIVPLCHDESIEASALTHIARNGMKEAILRNYCVH